MEIVEGRATHVKNALDVRRDEPDYDSPLGEQHGPPSVTHRVSFQLGTRAVQISSRELVRIAEGDQVLLAGMARRGAFDALAYRNLSSFAEGDRGWLPELAVGVILSALGAFMLVVGARASQPNPFALGVGALLSLAGVYLAYRGQRVRAAVGALRRHSA